MRQIQKLILAAELRAGDSRNHPLAELGRAIRRSVELDFKTGLAAQRRGIGALGGLSRASKADRSAGVALATRSALPELHELCQGIETQVGRFSTFKQWNDACDAAMGSGDDPMTKAARMVARLYTSGTRKRVGNVYTTIEGEAITTRLHAEARAATNHCRLVDTRELTVASRELRKHERPLALEAIGLTHVLEDWWGWLRSDTLGGIRVQLQSLMLRVLLIESGADGATVGNLASRAALDQAKTRQRLKTDRCCRKIDKARWTISTPGE